MTFVRHGDFQLYSFLGRALYVRVRVETCQWRRDVRIGKMRGDFAMRAKNMYFCHRFLLLLLSYIQYIIK